MFGHHRYAALPRVNRLCPCGNLWLLVPVTVPAIIERPQRAIRLAGQARSAQAQTKIALTEPLF
jgi:hypothetical protein